MVDGLIPATNIQPEHIRMARAGIKLSIRQLAELANMNKATIVRIEAGLPTRDKTLTTVRQILEDHGAKFWISTTTNKVLISVDSIN